MTTRTCVLALALVVSPVWTVCEAQQIAVGQGTPALETTETNRAPIIPFLEGTDVFWTLVRKDALDENAIVFPNKLEADIFPHLVFYQDFTDVLDIDRQAENAAQRLGLKEHSRVFSGTPAVRVRMLRDRSAPVRTPSYMPRGNFQWLWVRGLKDAMPRVAPGDAPAARTFQELVDELRAIPRVSIWEGHIIGGHHSNGQEGCLSNEQQLVPPPPSPDSECVPPGLVPTAETMNRISGSFSSQFFFRIGVNYSRNWMQPGAADFAAFRELRGSVEFEYHPRAWVDEQMRDIYGRHRLNLGAAYATKNVRFCPKRLEWSGGVTWNPGVVNPELDWSGKVQASCFPWVNGGWGLFLRLYTGQDYYNVGFLDDVTRLHVGLTFNQADFFRFRRRTPPPTR